MSPLASSRTPRRIMLHGARATLFALVIVLIRDQSRQLQQHETTSTSLLEWADVQPFFPDAASIAAELDAGGEQAVMDAMGVVRGSALQTSPESDHCIGFSGPTNLLVAISAEGQIRGVKILSSGDTRDHVAQVRDDGRFLSTFEGHARNRPEHLAAIDAVSGATLTSIAIQQAVMHRLGGERRSLLFPDVISLEDARRGFPNAGRVRLAEELTGWWHVSASDGESLGALLRTSPAADQQIGYQGPTDTLIALGPQGRVQGISIRESFDNEPYVSYLREDRSFPHWFDGLTLDELAHTDLAARGIEGVSGATMTSRAVAEGIVMAAKAAQVASHSAAAADRFTWRMRDLGTAAVIFGGLSIGLTRLRAYRWLRVLFFAVLIGYLGLANGDMVSQAMLVGWAQHGIPWRNAGGLILLTVAAFLVPLMSRRNVYCTHLCPHGAAQQLLKRRVPWQPKLSRRWAAVLKWLPVGLLAWVVVVAMTGISFSLVDIEPFDAWVLGVGGAATVTIAVVGLVASLFVPMAYCRYGCPTGTLLNFLRFNRRSDSWSRRDTCALILLLVATGLWLV